MLDLRERSRLGLLTGLALAALLLTPLLGPGYVLVRDMVFVPRTPLGGQLLGVGGVPRGVPSELLVALATRVVAAGWFQDLVLLALVVGGAWGAARLAPTSSRAGTVAAATVYGWSPYLHERLLLGQWALLVGWAVLPWAVRAALDWRRGAPGWWAVAALAVAALGGANSLLLVGLTVVLCGRPLRALGAVAALSLPWLVPGLLQDVVAGDPTGVEAFSSNSDTPFGVLGSLLTGGGVWSSTAVPPGRPAGSMIALAVLAVAAVGLPLVRSRMGDRLFVAAGLGLVLALLGRLPLLDRVLRWAVVHVPASGVLRDGQKWVAPLVLLVSAAVACGAERLLLRLPDLPVRRLAAALVVLSPLAALPGAAWGEGGRLTVSDYPADWERVTRQAHGAVLVLPWTLYRAFPWVDERTVLDPATKLLVRPVLNDLLPLTTLRVRGEDPLAARLDPAVRAGRPMVAELQIAGVDQVLVEHTTAGPPAPSALTEGLPVVADTPELTLYAVPSSRGTPATQVSPWVVLGDVTALAFGLLALTKARLSRRTLLPAP